MAIPSYTTTVEVEKTTDEIRVLLRGWGCRETTEVYDESGNIVGIRFVMTGINYCLNVDYNGVYGAMHKKGSDVPLKFRSISQARRVAWRNLLGWLKYTHSVVEMGLFTRERMLMPYHVMTNGQTLWEAYHDRNLKLEGK